MSALTRRPPARGLFAWLPLGLWLAGVLALVRAGAEAELVHLRAPLATESEGAIRVWELARAFPAAMLGGLVVGLLAAALASRTVARPELVRGGAKLAGSFVTVLLLAFFAGWFTEPPHLRARLESGHLFSHLGVQAVLAFVITAFLFHFARANQLGLPTRRLFEGPVASVAALLVAVLAPLAWLWLRQCGAPRFAQRVVAYEFLAHPETWRVIEAPEGAAPALGMLTPAAASETDSGDKPALLLPPNCVVELTVPADVGPCVLRAAAGVDQRVRGQMPEGLDALDVELEVSLEGTSVFEEVVRSERGRVGVYTPEEWVWRHVGGAEGIPVRPGQTIRLAARLGELPAGVTLPPGYPRVGFGDLCLERTIRRARAAPSAEHPSVVLIVMDTQRADRLSCYGYERPTTPHLDALASRGTRYEHAYSTASWTWPATASILTGLEPELHGVLAQDRCTLQLAFDTLAEVLQEKGYTTHAVSCNPLIAAERHFDQGFESFVPPPAVEFKKSEAVMPAVLRWVRAHAGVRFFLYLHLVDPHVPHTPDPREVERLGLVAPPDFPPGGMAHYNDLLQRRPPDVLLDEVVPADHRRWIHDQYDASVATGDRWVGELLATLAELGLDERTVIAFTSDHGEELFDHGLLEHGHTVHEELVRVPLILAGPGVPAGARVERVVSNRHVAPTLARLAGTRLATGGDGEDLLGEGGAGLAQFQTYKGLWPEGAPGARTRAKRQKLAGLRRHELALHWREPAGREPEPGDYRLYDLSLDPRGTSDVSVQRAGERDALARLLRERVEAQRAAAPEFPVGGSDAIDAMLGALGYADGEGTNGEGDGDGD